MNPRTALLASSVSLWLLLPPLSLFADEAATDKGSPQPAVAWGEVNAGLQVGLMVSESVVKVKQPIELGFSYQLAR